MSAKPNKTAEQELKEVARKFAERLVETANDDDPAREAAYQKREAAREESVTEALKKHLARSGSGQRAGSGKKK
jgi:hypothetical protein